MRHAEADAASRRDALTGVANRRHLKEVPRTLSALCAAKRKGQNQVWPPLSAADDSGAVVMSISDRNALADAMGEIYHRQAGEHHHNDEDERL